MARAPAASHGLVVLRGPAGHRRAKRRRSSNGYGTSDRMSHSDAEATHPRCECEGYPDRPGRASRKEGESWIIARLLWVWIRRSCGMRLRSDAGRGSEVRFLGEIDNTPAATAKL